MLTFKKLPSVKCECVQMSECVWREREREDGGPVYVSKMFYIEEKMLKIKYSYFIFQNQTWW